MFRIGLYNLLASYDLCNMKLEHSSIKIVQKKYNFVTSALNCIKNIHWNISWLVYKLKFTRQKCPLVRTLSNPDIHVTRTKSKIFLYSKACNQIWPRIPWLGKSFVTYLRSQNEFKLAWNQKFYIKSSVVFRVNFRIEKKNFLAIIMKDFVSSFF